MAFSVSEALDSVSRALGSVANTISNYFGSTSPSDPYNYDDQPYLAGDGRSTVYDVAPPEAILHNGPLEFGGIAHMSEKNVLDGYVKTFTLQTNNVEDNNVAAKHAYYFVDEDGSAPGAVDVNMTGSGKANLMIGTAGENTIRGLDGNDVLVGRDGNDVLEGGTGNDKITGGRGSDRATGGAGIDEYHMGGGNDTVTAGIGDEVWTGADVDTIRFDASGLKNQGIDLKVRNFDLDGVGVDAYDILDLAGSKADYHSSDVSGFRIVEDDGIYGVTVVDGDDGRMTLEHDWNGLKVDISFKSGTYFAGSRAEALDIIEHPLHADWIHFV